MEDMPRVSNASSESNENELLDLSHLELMSDTLASNFETEDNQPGGNPTKVLLLHHNRLTTLPHTTAQFQNLRHLDLNNNHFRELPDAVLQLQQLQTLTVRANLLEDHSLPKEFGQLACLEVLNLSGNMLTTIPPQILELSNLKALHLGGNSINRLPHDIWKLERLETLYLGGNYLQEIPTEVGQLHHLRALILCENQLQSLPSSVSCLKRLRSLALHKNNLTTLPPEIVSLKGLVELSLRDNPLVVRFVRDMTYDPPKLLELTARCIKTCRIPFQTSDIPANLATYLSSAQRCVNPKCKGVYFDARVEHIKFVDFCGKYRLPLQQYLCSPSCTTQPTFPASSGSSSESDDSDSRVEVPVSKLRRVLLG